jgi:hypothetical protein
VEAIVATSGSIFLEHYFDILSMFTVILPWRTTKQALIQVADSTAKHPPAATSTKQGSIDKVILYTKAKC